MASRCAPGHADPTPGALLQCVGTQCWSEGNANPGQSPGAAAKREVMKPNQLITLHGSKRFADDLCLFVFPVLVLTIPLEFSRKKSCAREPKGFQAPDASWVLA